MHISIISSAKRENIVRERSSVVKERVVNINHKRDGFECHQGYDAEMMMRVQKFLVDTYHIGNYVCIA